jgi:subtilisin family serine protease
MRRFVILVVCLVCGLLAQPSVLAAPPPPGPAAAAPGVVVRFASKQIQAQTVPGYELSLDERGYRLVDVPPGETREQFIAELKANPDVLSAQPDAPAYAAVVPDDPYYPSYQANYLTQINAPAAWDLETGKDSVVVAVLDSGLDINHPDFFGRLWENTHDATTNGIDDDGNGCIDDRYGCRFVDVDSLNAKNCGYTSSVPTGAILDDDGGPTSNSHGTFVAGIIGAAGSNGIGVTGLDWNVKLMTVKVLDCGQNGAPPATRSMFGVAKGIDYARQNGARIINMSLAGAPGDETADLDVLRTAIQSAANQGVIIVAAAGNHDSNATKVSPGYPAAYTQFPNLVAVGAATPSGDWANFSNYGPSISLAAPGVGIASTLRSDLGSTALYGSSEGTSFATPLVTGMFALMMSRNSGLTATDYIALAKSAASSVPLLPNGGNWAGAGIINVGAAVARVPMTINGAALADWQDVPDATEVRATVNGTDCGATKVQSFLSIARYSVRVQSDAEHPGCGAPGRVVQLSVGGVAAYPTFTWPGQNADLALLSRDVSTISPPPGPVVVQSLNGSWSNVAVLDPGGPLPESLSAVTTIWNSVLRWDPLKPFLDSAGAYQHYSNNVPAYVNDLTAVSQYDALWIDAGAAPFATANPNPPPGRTLLLQPGWNNFVWTGSAKQVEDALAAASGLYSQVLQFDNATQRWLSYLPGQPRVLNNFGGLFKLKVYWVYMIGAATVVMD